MLKLYFQPIDNRVQVFFFFFVLSRLFFVYTLLCREVSELFQFQIFCVSALTSFLNLNFIYFHFFIIINNALSTMVNLIGWMTWFHTN